MFDRKKAKAAARKNVFRHYWKLVFICLLVAYFGVKYESSLDFVNAFRSDSSADRQSEIVVSGSGSSNMLLELFSGNIGVSVDEDNKVTNNFEESKEKYKENKNKSFKVGDVEVSYSDGEFAKIANIISSGSYVWTMYSGIRNITGSDRAATIIVVIIGLLVKLFMAFFVFNVLSAVMSRIFLEARIYEKVPVKSFFALLKTRKWFRAALTLMVKDIYLVLWSLTIIMPFIKMYSYQLVPYITAENPDLSPNEAITLSRKLMNGHKFEYFKVSLSFLGWSLLSLFTGGLFGLFWVNPYKEATLAEFYAAVRSNAKAGDRPNAAFIDKFLFEKAGRERLAAQYSDIDDLKKETEAFTDHYTGARAFFANVFGIVPRYSAKTEAIDKNEINKIRMNQYLDELEGRAYPERLSPFPIAERRDKLSTIYYTRSYSIISIILMFFIGSFIGWAWEVTYKYVEVGKLVNRGVLHGPWLPIYGAGAVMILVVLKKFRHRPVIEFFAAVVLCGIVEYYTAYILEMTHDGQKWWDYSGYFLNINGRVCAEGLMVFGIGGVAFVYFLAPMIDNHLRKLRMRIALPVCILLVSAFCADFVYSHFYPNQGEGITDYQTASDSSQTSDDSE